MQTKTVRTPIQIQLLFLLIIALGAIWFLFSYQYSQASILEDYCQRQFDQSFRYKISNWAFKKCQTRFDYITEQWAGFKINNK